MNICHVSVEFKSIIKFNYHIFWQCKRVIEVSVIVKKKKKKETAEFLETQHLFLNERTSKQNNIFQSNELTKWALHFHYSPFTISYTYTFYNIQYTACWKLDGEQSTGYQLMLAIIFAVKWLSSSYFPLSKAVNVSWKLLMFSIFTLSSFVG